MKVAVKPRDLRSGDCLPVMQDDLTIAYVPVVQCEMIRPRGATRYKVTLEGLDRPIYFHPNATVEVQRD